MGNYLCGYIVWFPSVWRYDDSVALVVALRACISLINPMKNAGKTRRFNLGH